MRDLRTQVPLARSVSGVARTGGRVNARPHASPATRGRCARHVAQTRHHQVRIDGKFRGFLALARPGDGGAKLEPSTVGHDSIEVVAVGVKGFELPTSGSRPSERIETRFAEIGNFAFLAASERHGIRLLLSAC